MPVVHAFVAEIPVQLVHPLEAAHHEALQIELRRDAQVERHVERVQMRDERPGVRTAVERLQHGGLHFEESPVVQPLAHGLDDLRPLFKSFAHVGIDDEIHVALAVALLLVREAVPFFRERPEGLGKDGEALHAHGHFAGVGGEDRPFEADDIADVEELEELPLRLRELVFAEIELDVARLVAEHAERGLAVIADDHDAARHAHVRLARLERFRFGADVRGVVVPLEPLPERRVAQLPDLLELFPADEHLVVQIFRGSILIVLLIVCHLLCFPLYYLISST